LREANSYIYTYNAATDPYGNLYSHSNYHGLPDTDGNGDADSYGNSNGYIHTHPNAQSDAHPEDSAYTAVSSHSSTTPVGNLRD